MQSARAQHEAQSQRNKLTRSYNELLDVFSSEELSSVGNYTLGRLIGKGSFGKVYLATHKLTNGSKVVLKSAKKNDQNLAREIHHHRQFLHPHIARLYEVIVTESLVWLVLEYCPGDELYNYLLNHGALPVEKVQRIFAQLVGAVSYVHNKSCVHRDLKLENILLDKHENVKLVDFGFTREYEKMKNHLQTFCGTVCYSAPEMLRAEKYAGEKVDVWSLGIILFALLAGELPFDEDDDMATKQKILNTDPKYPETMPDEVKTLIGKMLSKRPLIRPTLADILNDPFLAEFSPTQQAILKVARPAPFATPVEKDCLERMRSAGVDIDKVIENVLAQRMDALGGWWALLIEKEERKAARRELKRKEKEAEIKSLRRISAASSRMMTPTLKDVEEEMAMTTQSRGRQNRRSFPSSPAVVPDLPRLPEGASLAGPDLKSPTPPPPPPIEKDSIRSASSSRNRPPVPSKDREVRRRSQRNSQLQLANANGDLLAPPGVARRRGRRNVTFIFSTIKHWIVELPRRARSPHNKAVQNANDRNPAHHSAPNLNKSRPPGSAGANSGPTSAPRNAPTPIRQGSSPLRTPTATTPRTARATTSQYTHRQSLSPAPLTPHSSFRRSSAGLRGRKSTSSSVSSIRSIHHVHTHSKTSSTSSNVDSVVSSAFGPTGGRKETLGPRSPHSPSTSSIKVLPATPTAGGFPPGIRLARGPPAPLHLGGMNPSLGAGLAGPSYGTHLAADAPFGGPMPSPGLVFAKRKKTPFRGPMLSLTVDGGSHAGVRSRSREKSGGPRRSSSMSRGGKGMGGTSIVEEEDEEDEDDIEEVDAFSPIEREEEEVILEDPQGLNSLTAVSSAGTGSGSGSLDTVTEHNVRGRSRDEPLASALSPTPAAPVATAAGANGSK